MLDKNNKKVTKKITLHLILSVSLLVAIVIILSVLIFALYVCSATKNQAFKSVTSLNSEVGLALDRQLMNLRDSASVVCADDSIGVILEAGHSDLENLSDEENHLKNILSKTASVNNFANYSLVFEDGFTLGVLNEDTRNFAGSNDLYTHIATILDNGETVWTTDVTPEKNLISYIVRLNDTTVMLASLEAEYLTGIMDAADYLDGITGYICDKKFIIQCTSDGTVSAGALVRSSISKMVYTVGGTKSNGEYIVSSSVLCNGWLSVIAVPQNKLLMIIHGPTRVMIPIGITMLIVSVLYTIAMTYRIIGGVDRTVDKLNDKSQNDLLTGLLNKRTFEEYVKNRLENPVTGCSYALVFMDVDNFKGVNDRCGHEMGDEVLRSFAHSMGATFRELDLKGRLGGDEFAVLMEINSTDRMMAIRIVNEACKRFRDRLHQKAHSARQSIPAVTSSIGAAIWKGDGEGFEAIYRKADNALYTSKEKGKDTWTIYGLTEADLKSALEKTEDM